MRLLARSGLLLALACACRSTPSPEIEQEPPHEFDLVIEGNDQVTTGKLEAAMALDLEAFASSGFQRSFADDAAYQAEVTYFSLGYPFAEVLSFDISGPEDHPTLTLRIQEGPQTIIDLSAFVATGVTAFSTAEMQAFLDGPRLGFLDRGELLYVADRVSSVPNAIVSEYIARGYVDVRVAEPEVTFSSDNTRAQVAIHVDEGQRRVVGDVRLSPIAWPRPPESDEEEDDRKRREERILAHCARCAPEPGAESPKAFYPRLPTELAASVREILGNFGYPDALVTVAIESPEAGDPSTDRPVHLLLTVEPGPRVTVGAIRIEGNEQTRTSFLESLLQFHEGSTWRNQKSRKSVNRIYDTGLFHRVTLDLEKTSDEVRDILVTVEEGPSREYFIEPGYGSYELLRLKAGMVEKNVFGSGRRVRADSTWAVRALRATVGVTSPWFSHPDVVADVVANFEERENPSFTNKESGIGAFLTRKWDFRRSDDATTFGYQFRATHVSDVDVVDEDVTEAQEDVDISSLRLSHRHDRRNNPFLPSDGAYAEGTLEWGGAAIGSELDFVRFSFFLASYIGMGDRTILALALRGGVIVPTGDDDTIPLQERYFNGGENTVRSFRESELGPKDEDDEPLGGEVFSALSVELRRRLAESRLELAFFVDAGTLEEDASDFGELDVSTGIGLGLRYMLPVGPLRLDVAMNPDPGDDEDDFVVHVAIGIAF